MGRSAAECARDRAAVRENQAREALALGNTRDALWVGLKGIASEVAKLRDRRPGDGALTDADLTALLLHLAEGLHGHRPARPRGCPPLPRPADLLAMFDERLAEHAAGSAA
jgi:hypothetical protein